ncbi:MAG: hypothetical protein LBR66_09470 [Candidatus Symbiothrix sp.]|nr:hypothetical protein [Candidatus Symbiothrix sp.]
MKTKLMLASLLCCAYLSCDERYESPIPDAPVNLSLDLRYEDSHLVALLAYKTFTQGRLANETTGFGGVLVVNGAGANGLINLYAYDLACPVETDRTIRIVPNETGTAVCPKCGAKYDIAYGTGVAQSGGKYPLKAYPVRKKPTDMQYQVIY